MDAKPLLAEVARHLETVKLEAVLDVLEKTLEEVTAAEARQAARPRTRK